MDDARARALLTDELRRIDDEYAAHRRGGPLRPDEDDRRAVDEADRASRETETMEADLAADTLQVQRRRIESALGRLDRGEYGRCAVCGREIDEERLAARPETDRCRDHPEVEPGAGGSPGGG